MGNSYQMMAQELSPSHRAYKRTKRSSSGSFDTTPVHIQPHPDGIRNMIAPRAVNMPPKPRAPGRGRRDPQAEEEDALVESLREQGVAWKIVRLRFQETFKKDATEARLQMRLLRRQRDQATRWNLSDVSRCFTDRSCIDLRPRTFLLILHFEFRHLISKRLTDIGKRKNTVLYKRR